MMLDVSCRSPLNLELSPFDNQPLTGNLPLSLERSDLSVLNFPYIPPFSFELSTLFYMTIIGKPLGLGGCFRPIADSQATSVQIQRLPKAVRWNVGLAISFPCAGRFSK